MDNLNRRAFLAALGLGTAALAGCDVSNSPLMANLPDGNPLDSGYFPPTLPKGSPPPLVNPQVSSSGVILRSAWAKAGPDLKRVVPIGEKKIITFHHSGDPKPFTGTTYAETAQHLESVREYHVSKNFQDIGYHFGIDRAGRVWQLRSLQYQGEHVRNHNPNNIGVVVLGNFDLQPMTDAQRQQVKVFGAMLRKQYGLAISNVKTHQELVSTECPGTGMQPYMVSVRKQGLI